MQKVAIVILNWNGLEMLKKYLPTVIAHSSSLATTWIADNASTDASVGYVRQYFPEVKLLTFEHNFGFAEGYNRALKAIDAEYYVLLNSDVEVTEGWLQPLLTFMENHPEAAACQPKLRAVYDPQSFEYAGGSGGFLDRYGYPFCRGRLFDTIERDEQQYDDICPVGWATGAALFVRAADYHRIGGLDARFFAHNEEIDFCWRLQLHGRYVYCVPDSVVYHVGGGTLPKSNPMKTFLNFRNNLTMLYKNLPEKDLKKVMRIRWFLDYVAAWQALLLQRNLGDFLAVFRARKAFRKWRHDFDLDRAVHCRADANALDARKPYSLLWHYYFKGHRHFSQLPVNALRK